MNYTEFLIEQVRQNECLYDLRSGDYKNVLKKQKIWESIGQSLHIDAEEARKKWKGLRDTYKKRKRAALAPSGSGAVPSKRWKFMDQMSFLDDIPDSRPTVGNCETPIIAKEKNLTLEDSADCSLFLSTCESDMLEPHYQNQNTTECANSPIVIDEENWDAHILYDPQESEINVGQKNKPTSKKQADAEITSVFKEVMKECSNTIQKIASSPTDKVKEPDSTSLLFESLARTISDAKIPQEIKRNIESKVVALVYAEISKANSQ